MSDVVHVLALDASALSLEDDEDEEEVVHGLPGEEISEGGGR